jgi:hypothetical protein
VVVNHSHAASAFMFFMIERNAFARKKHQEAQLMLAAFEYGMQRWGTETSPAFVSRCFVAH